MSDISVDGFPASGAPFRVGDVLGKAFSVFGGRLGSFLVLAFVPLIPVLVLKLMAVFEPHVGPQLSLAVKFDALATVLFVVLGSMAQATALYGAFQQMAGRSFSIGESLGVGFGRALPVLGVALLATLLIFLAAILLVVPGMIVLCMFYVAVPVCVIEKPGITESLSRSALLTKGCRWQIFGLFALVLVAGILVQFPMALVGRLTLLGALFHFSWEVLATAFGAVLAAVVYHDLRVAKEGMDVDNLANVFD